MGRAHYWLEFTMMGYLCTHFALMFVTRASEIDGFIPKERNCNISGNYSRDTGLPRIMELIFQETIYDCTLGDIALLFLQDLNSYKEYKSCFEKSGSNWTVTKTTYRRERERNQRQIAWRLRMKGVSLDDVKAFGCYKSKETLVCVFDTSEQDVYDCILPSR